jgi:adhesin transport system membrane fusion protein
VINRLLVTTVGGVVKPGEPIAEIVPAEDLLVIEARIRPQDIGFVQPGMLARIKLTAYDYSIFGSMEGTVTQISADAVPSDDRTQPNSFYFLARVETTGSGIEAYGRRLPIIPGMQAQVDIITGNKTVMNYLSKPLIAVRENAFRER